MFIWHNYRWILNLFPIPHSPIHHCFVYHTPYTPALHYSEYTQLYTSPPHTLHYIIHSTLHVIRFHLVWFPDWLESRVGRGTWLGSTTLLHIYPSCDYEICLALKMHFSMLLQRYPGVAKKQKIRHFQCIVFYILQPCAYIEYIYVHI